MSTRFQALVLSLLLPLASSSLVACAKDAGHDGGSEQVIDESLLAWLSASRSLHHEADIAEDKGDFKAAIATLERALGKQPPRTSPEVSEVWADTHARLGDLRSRTGDFEGAHRDVEKGLENAPGVSYFRGHLLEVRGLVEERRAKALDGSGDKAGADKAREAAMKAYEESIAVQDEVIKRGTGGGKP